LTVVRFPFNVSLMLVLRRARWLGALLIAPVLVCAIAATTYIGQRCRLTGMVTLDACCPQAADESSMDEGNDDSRSQEQATVSDPGCCERLLITVAKVTGDASERGFEAPVHWATSLISTLLPRELRSLAPVARARRRARPPGAAPPAFLLRHSFLI
jgi:hypothetical protein